MWDVDLQLLNSPDEDTRCAAIVRLGEGNVNQFLDLLMSALSDPSWRVRKAVVQVLEKAEKPRLIPLLIQALGKEDAGVRNSAIECLISIGKDAVDPLCKILSDPDKDTRIFAANTLGTIGDRTAYPYLIKALKDPEKNVCQAAIDALGKVKDFQAVASLIQIVQEEDIWLKLPAIAALGELKDPRAIPYLLPLAQDPLFKQTVVEALGTLGDESSVPCLIQALEDQDPEIQKAALLALKKVVSHSEKINRMMGCSSNLRESLNRTCTEKALHYLIKTSEDDNIELAEMAIFLLGWLEFPSAIETLIHLLEDERLSNSAMEALLNSGIRSLPALIDSYEFNPQKLTILECMSRLSLNLLSDEEEIISSQESLLKMLKVFTDCLKDEEEDIQIASLQTLASDKFIKFLKSRIPQESSLFEEIVLSTRQILQSHNPFLRAEAIKLIGPLEEASALGILQEATKDLEGRVRAAAIAQIGWLAQQNRDLLDSVIVALSDDDPKVREQAALALGAISQPEALNALILAIQDEDFRVKRAVIRALRGFQDPQILETLEYILPHCKRREDGMIRVTICETLGGFIDSEKSVALLIEMLTDYDFAVRRTAAITLGFAKKHRELIRDSLLKALEDPHWGVQEAAVKSLGTLGFKSYEDLFLNLLNHAETGLRKEAMRALGEIKSERALDPLFDLLMDDSLSQEAYQTLRKLASSHKHSIQEKGRLHQNPLVQRFVKSVVG